MTQSLQAWVWVAFLGKVTPMGAEAAKKLKQQGLNSAISLQNTQELMKQKSYNI